MNASIKILLASLFSCSATMIFAANKTTLLELEVNYTPYVKLLGSAVGITKFFSVEDIKPLSGGRPWVTIGSLGLESNISGSCTLDFASNNGFRLRHTVSNRRLTRYILRYKGNRINRRNTTVVLPSCNQALSSLELKRRGRFRNNVQAGIYQDIVTLTVTTQ